MSDYGRKPYFGAKGEDYQDLMRKVPKKAIYDKKVERDSEFEKPYLNDNYPEMQQYYKSNYDLPYSPTDFDMDLPIIKDGRGEGACEGAVINVESTRGPFPTIPCGSSIQVYMAGHNGEGQPWGAADIVWWYQVGSTGSTTRVPSGGSIVIPSCQELTERYDHGQLINCTD